MSGGENAGACGRGGAAGLLTHYADLIRMGMLSAVLVGVTWVAETGVDGGFVKDIWAGLKVASPTLNMILFWLYLRADSERQRAQQECAERTVDFIESTNLQAHASEKSLTTITAALQALKSRPRRYRAPRTPGGG